MYTNNEQLYIKEMYFLVTPRSYIFNRLHEGCTPTHPRLAHNTHTHINEMIEVQAHNVIKMTCV